jgi:hypothetical protein
MTDYWNRPVYKTQVHTANIARQILNLPSGNLATRADNPILYLRLLPAYRCAYSLRLRKQIADIVRDSRKAGTYKLEKVSP